MSGEDEYKESVGNYTDLKPALNASQPVHTVKENVGDSHSIAAGFAERATGNPDNFEQGEEAIASEKREKQEKHSSESANGESQEKKPSSSEKEPVPTPEQSEEAERAILLADYEARKDEEPEGLPPNFYTGKVVLSTVAVIVAGIATLIFKATKSKKSEA